VGRESQYPELEVDEEDKQFILTEEQEIKVLHENPNVEPEIKSASQFKVFENISIIDNEEDVNYFPKITPDQTPIKRKK
jgi:hypothetical protein